MEFAIKVIWDNCTYTYNNMVVTFGRGFAFQEIRRYKLTYRVMRKYQRNKDVNFLVPT